MKLLRMIVSVVLIGLCALHAQAGTINGTITTASSGPIRNGVLTYTLNQVAVISGTAQVVTTGVQCYTDGSGNIVGEPDLTVAPSASVNLGAGTLAAGTYFVKIAIQDASGISNVSPEGSFTLSGPGTLIVNAPTNQAQLVNATGYRIYIGTASGNETLQGTVTGTPGTWANFSQAAALAAGSAMPGSNTTVCSIAFQDSMIPTTTYYSINMVNAQGSKIAGYPISPVRFFGGSAGSVNISNGWPVSIGGVIYPTPIVSTPNSNAAQSIFSPLNMNGFALQNVGTFSPASIGSTANSPATSGFVRMATGDSVCWRNVALNANVCLSTAGIAAAGTGNLADLMKWSGGGFQGAAFVDQSAAPANSGVVRTGNNVCAVASRNAAGNGDVCAIQVNASNQTVITSPSLTGPTIDIINQPAATVFLIKDSTGGTRFSIPSNGTSPSTLNNTNVTGGSTLTSPSVITGISQGSGLKHQRFGGLCTTGATGSTCTTAITWTSAFADANYTVSCTGITQANLPALAVEGVTASGFTVRITAISGSATYATVDCIAVHD